MADSQKLRLEFPLAPKRGRLSDKDWEKCLTVEPMDRLPAPLIPKDGSYKLRPPRLHYGWALGDPDVLLEVARAKNIPPRDRNKPTAPPKNDRSSINADEDEEGDEEEGYDTEDDSEACPPSVSMTTSWLRMDALDAVAKELELEGEPYVIEVFLPGKGRVRMVALTNNYELSDRLLKRRDFDELRKYLKFEGGPMWYLDTYHWTWNSERYWNR
ncbi:hypothetical protein SCHPADRAFT_294507 [Schizopora paradoxa]|uniref:Uncharacterized protein n=1 Tax=Schizopora paradoxa TaxID=27342 RepID=A0A0H2RZ77_9AGAM|nr:hypothetical protein SCHPADRAFT_294507 [Schizopora paradoxa]